MEETKIKFYDEKEIEEIINSNEQLYYADDGIDEVIVREQDIPDFIMLVNKIEGYDASLKFYKKGAMTMNPSLTTIGPFLDKADLDLREKIIDRLVLLQQFEVEPKDIKVIIEDMYEKVEEDMEFNLNKKKGAR